MGRRRHQHSYAVDGEVDLVYNGQLYNFQGLRAELEAKGLRFRTECDTEVFLKAYIHYGAACFEKYQEEEYGW